ncbi:MAG TPA: hypothetical protein DCG51_09070 [Erysipelotrichaceae bacterium]|nr:hypothetical protein [Erysipelotrichaceae bacterium]
MSLKNLMKKALSFGLAAAMLTACSGGGSASGGESGGSEGGSSASDQKYKIGILEVQLNDESTNRAEYFRNYIGPEYNVEFMFSEAISDLDAALSFLENAADAGCDAIINYYPVKDNTEQLVQKAAELGMVFVENGGRGKANDDTYAAKYDNFAGGFQADQPNTGALFKKWMEENIDTSEEHGYLIATGGAYQGNDQQTQISANMLSALEELYGLKFDLTKEELYQSSSPIDGTNDKGIEVYCYPGMPTANGWLEGLTAALQTGKYDYILTAPNVIGSIGTAVNELETAMNKDFTWIGFGTFGDALKTAISTKDSFGNQTVAMSTVKFTSIVSAMAFAKVYNTLTGHHDVNLVSDGTSVNLFRMNAVTSPEQLEAMASWDQPGRWVADIDFVNSLITERGGATTNEEFQNNIYKLDYDAIYARLGK